MPPDDEVLLVPQAASSGPPKASPAPTKAESLRNSRLDLREKLLISVSPVSNGGRVLGGRQSPVARDRVLGGSGGRPIAGSLHDPPPPSLRVRLPFQLRP